MIHVHNNYIKNAKSNKQIMSKITNSRSFEYFNQNGDELQDSQKHVTQNAYYYH